MQITFFFPYEWIVWPIFRAMTNTKTRKTEMISGEKKEEIFTKKNVIYYCFWCKSDYASEWSYISNNHWNEWDIFDCQKIWLVLHQLVSYTIGLKISRYFFESWLTCTHFPTLYYNCMQLLPVILGSLHKSFLNITLRLFSQHSIIIENHFYHELKNSHV